MLGTHLIPKLFLLSSKNLVKKVFVKGSAMFSVEVIISTSTYFLDTISCIKWYFLSMCLPFQWFLGFLDGATVPLLSQNNTRGDTIKGITPSPIRNFQSQMTSFSVSEAITYLTSIVESTIQDYFTLFQLTTLPPKANTNLEVDLREFLLDWKFKSVYLRGWLEPKYGSNDTYLIWFVHQRTLKSPNLT